MRKAISTILALSLIITLCGAAWPGSAAQGDDQGQGQDGGNRLSHSVASVFVLIVMRTGTIPIDNALRIQVL